jgi:hypothetical protein
MSEKEGAPRLAVEGQPKESGTELYDASRSQLLHRKAFLRQQFRALLLVLPPHADAVATEAHFDSFFEGLALLPAHEDGELLALFAEEPTLEGRRTNTYTLSKRIEARRNQLKFASKEVSTVEPQPLRRPSPAAKAFPFEALGIILGDAAKAIAEAHQVPDSIAAHSVMAAASYCAQAHVNVIGLKGTPSPTSEFFISIAESGDRKSTADEIALRPLVRFEARLRAQYDEDQFAYEREKECYDSNYKKCLDQQGAAREQAFENLGKPPPPPRSAIVRTEEPTYDGLVRNLREGMPSQALFTDEGGNFFGGHAMNKDNRMRTGAALNKLWDGGTITRSRASEGTYALPYRRVSSHIMIQPVIAPGIIGDPTLNGIGLFSRVLVVFPASLAGTRLYKKPSESALAAIQRHENRMDYLLSLPMPLREGTDGGLDPRDLSLSLQAEALAIKFHDEVEQQLSGDGHLAPIKAWASKATEHAIRLAAITQFFDEPTLTGLGASHIERILPLMHFYKDEVLRLANMVSVSPEIEQAEAVLLWLHNRWPHEYVSPRDIVQRGPNKVRETKLARKALQLLAEHEWLIKSDTPQVIAGQKTKEAYQVVRTEAAENLLQQLNLRQM